ncbi:single-stranded-DNA-specific exonuclease RecJ [Enterococcus casseliflavus]|uniref:single-stranded-DNA-specific exonuclease RecJ n=1 Tax=Enterococcus casseliflavus TaxID=37734 RepID=UPI00301826D9
MTVTWKPNPRLKLAEGIKDKDRKIQKVRDIKDIKSFLMPKPNVLNNGMKLKGMREAVSRTVDAIDNGQMIVVVGDADCDGVTSLTIARQYLLNYSDKIGISYAQKVDGHGIEHQLEFLENNYEHIDLLIIVDSSSNSVGGVKQIKEMFGCDVIILDHHEIEVRNLPDAIVVNPQQKGCTYPNKDLSGAGVVFKWVEQVEKALPNGVVDVWQYTDLVAVGMVADVMKVTDPENRYLMLHGMKNFNNIGLKRIAKGAKLNEDEISSTDIGFSIAPLINGAIRLGQIELPIQLLNVENDKEAKPIRLKMQKLNDKRKEQQAEYANYLINELGENPEDKILILSYDIPPEYNGLVAQTLAEKYQRPAIILNSPRDDGDIYGGSARSFNEFNLKSFLAESGLVDKAIGHAGALGVYIKEGNIPLLVDYIKEEYDPEAFTAEITKYYDIEISGDEVSEWIPIVKKFNRLSGRGFDKIIVKVKDLMVEEIKVMGQRLDTIKIATYEGVNLMKFRSNEMYASELDDMDLITAYGELNLNRWFRYGKGWEETPQVFIQDYEVN